MFTGLIQAVGKVVAHEHSGGESDLDIDLGPVAEHATIGASIALSGVCCTVVSCEGSVARFHLSPETLDRPWLGDAEAGPHAQGGGRPGVARDVVAAAGAAARVDAEG